MKLITAYMIKSIRRIECIFLTMVVAIPVFSQELTEIAKEIYFLQENYPNGQWSRGSYVSSELGDIINIGDTITIYAYNKNKDWTYVYNQKKMGYIIGIKYKDKSLYKQIMKSKIYTIDEETRKTKENEIRSSINDYYSFYADAYDREVFVKDSIEKRKAYLTELLTKRIAEKGREFAIRDSLEKVEKHQQDSIRRREIQEQREYDKRVEIEMYKFMDPFLMDVKYWSVDHEVTMSLGIQFVNCSKKVVKYVTFKGRFLNRVLDPVRELWKGGYTWSATGIGPMYPAPRTPEEYEHPQGKYDGKIEFENLYYFYPRNVASIIEVTSVTIEYMDGTKRTVTGNELKKRVMYSCHQ